MWRFLAAVGLVLTVGGLVSACWPEDRTFARTRRLVAAPTFTGRGPRVVVDQPASMVRDASGFDLSIPGLLGADGYWANARREYLTRERLTDARVLVVRGRLEALDGSRTRTLVARWITEGGALLVLAPGVPARQTQGAGRIATLDPSVLSTTNAVAALLDAMHWLTSGSTGSTRRTCCASAQQVVQ